MIYPIFWPWTTNAQHRLLYQLDTAFMATTILDVSWNQCCQTQAWKPDEPIHILLDCIPRRKYKLHLWLLVRLESSSAYINLTTGQGPVYWFARPLISWGLLNACACGDMYVPFFRCGRCTVCKPMDRGLWHAATLLLHSCFMILMSPKSCSMTSIDKSSLLAAWRFAGRPQQGAPNGPDASWQLAMHRPRER